MYARFLFCHFGVDETDDIFVGEGALQGWRFWYLKKAYHDGYLSLHVGQVGLIVD